VTFRVSSWIVLLAWQTRRSTNPHSRTHEVRAARSVRAGRPRKLRTLTLTLSQWERENQSFTFLNRSALPITETELKLIAAAAIIGLKRTPTKG
jgi:hypothetical protein